MGNKELVVNLKYLGRISDQVGKSAEQMKINCGATLAGLSHHLEKQYSLSLLDEGIIFTLNGKSWYKYKEKFSVKLKSGDLVCLFPIVAGG